MIYKIFKDKTPVTQIDCSPAQFHPTVSRTANLLLNKSKTGTVIVVKAGREIEWTGIKRFKKVVTGGL